MDDLKRKTVRGGFVTLLSQAAKVVLRMGSIMVLARLLDPKDFGLVGMVTVLTGIFEVIKDAGLSTVTVQRETITDAQISTLFWLNMLVGVVLALLCLALAPVLVTFYREPRLFWVTTALASGFIINAAAVQHSALLQRRMRFTTLALTEIVALAVGVTVAAGMALKGYGYWAIVGMTLTQAATTAIYVWFAAAWVPGMPRRNVGMRSMLQFGSTITMNGLVIYLAYNAEKVLLGRFWGAAALGLYGRAFQLIKLPTDLLYYSRGSVGFAARSRLQGDPKRFRIYFLKGYSLVLTLTLPLTLTCAMFAGEIVRVFLGPKWTDATLMLRLLAPTVLVFAAINPLGWLLYSTGRVGRSLKIALVIAPLVITADVVGLPWGPNGVAFAYSTAMVLWVVPHMAWCVQGTAISLKDLLGALGRPLVAGIAAALISYGVQMALGDRLSPMFRLAVEVTVLFGSYLAILVTVMGQKPLYMNLLQELRARPSFESTPPAVAEESI
jgi:O-antigen/teichoic acid export membrane protein